MRSRCGAYQRQTRSSSAGQPADFPFTSCTASTKEGQYSTAAAGDVKIAQSAHWVAVLGHSVEHARGGGRSDARQKLDHAESRDAVAWVFSPAQEREHVFDVRGLKKLQTAELHEWNVTPSQLHLKRPAVMRGAEQNSLRFECGAGLAVFQDLLDDVPRLIRFIAHADQLGSLGGAPFRPKVFGKALFGEIDHSVCRR